jgi:hypothetical protein
MDGQAGPSCPLGANQELTEVAEAAQPVESRALAEAAASPHAPAKPGQLAHPWAYTPMIYGFSAGGLASASLCAGVLFCRDDIRSRIFPNLSKKILGGIAGGSGVVAGGLLGLGVRASRESEKAFDDLYKRCKMLSENDEIIHQCLICTGDVPTQELGYLMSIPCVNKHSELIHSGCLIRHCEFQRSQFKTPTCPQCRVGQLHLLQLSRSMLPKDGACVVQ